MMPTPMPIHMTRADRARLDFVGGLMEYNSKGIGKAMADFYASSHAKDAPSAPRTEGSANGNGAIQEVAAILEDAPVYRFGAFFELGNHRLMFQTALEILGRQAEEARAWLDGCNAPGALGSLGLDPDLPIPKYYRKVDIHTQPGSYHGEFAGFLYHWMIGPFLVHRDDRDEMGWQLARGVPRKDYRRILDLGCGIGKSTFPYCDLHPQAEILGLDYAAPMLKYGHRLAEARGKKVQFIQRHAERTGLPEQSFDLVTAIWLFHELPRKARDQVVREAHRLLRPGGVFAIMESPPFKNLSESYSKLSAFLLDSTGRRMNDPWIPEFFKEDRVEMFRRGGFANARDLPLPNELTGWGAEESYFFGAYPWWMTLAEKV